FSLETEPLGTRQDQVIAAKQTMMTSQQRRYMSLRRDICRSIHEACLNVLATNMLEQSSTSGPTSADIVCGVHIAGNGCDVQLRPDVSGNPHGVRALVNRVEAHLVEYLAARFGSGKPEQL
ncbi:hypothetical protein MTO96_042196, partial [Rhipicephalus appendiculatus]